MKKNEDLYIALISVKWNNLEINLQKVYYFD